MTEATETQPAGRDALAEKVRADAMEIAEALEAAPTSEEKSKIFFSKIRESSIPYLPCRLRDEPARLYALCYEALFLLGRANLPLSVGFLMHQYNLSGLATLPVPAAPEFENRRKILVDTIEKYRSLLAISSFGSNVRAKDTPNPNVVVRENEMGEFVCNGRKNFQSMASNADLLLFSGYTEENVMGMFYCSLKSQKGIVPGPSLFSGAMALSDTKPIQFENVVIKRRNVLSLEEWLTYHVSNYCTSWFEALVSSAYLGAASKAIEETRKFARSVSADQKTTLSELDGFVLDSGRMSLKFRSALALAQSYGPVAEKYCKAVIGDAPEEAQDGICDDLMDLSGCIKYTCTKVAQDTVNQCRAMIGTRSMSTSHPIHALTEQICFGPLHPIIPARAERDEGEEMLEDKTYYGLYKWAFRP